MGIWTYIWQTGQTGKKKSESTFKRNLIVGWRENMIAIVMFVSEKNVFIV